jgi:hypothetical protein
MKEIKTHIKALIKFYEELIEVERVRKSVHSSKISTRKESRQICETASIRISCYTDFINHFKGCLTVLVGSELEAKHKEG